MSGLRSRRRTSASSSRLRRRVRGERSDEPPDDAVLTARVLDTLYEKAGLALRGARNTS